MYNSDQSEDAVFASTESLPDFSSCEGYKITDQELLSFNAQGFIPGPGETEGRFLERINAVKSSLNAERSVSRAQWEWVRNHLQGLFDFKPQSLIAFYSNEHLAPWQGAACWITEEGVPKLQLREGFRKGKYLGLYSREETLAHEAIHAARAGFEEEGFEEFFAYASAQRKWRKVLGPIVKKPWEAWIFLTFLVIGIFWGGGFLAATLWMSVGFYRLAKQHYCLTKAFRVLIGRLKQEKKARSVLLRLTDREIEELAAGTWLDGDTSLRWRLIRLAYFQ